MKLRYSHFAHRIDVDAMVEALNIEFIDDESQEMRAFCPLPHNAHTNGDTTGKFSINRDKGVYNCWVCGGGNFLDLAMTMLDLDPEPAIKWLYQFANHEETDDEFLSHLDELLADPADKQPSMPFFNERVLDRWEPAIGHEWLESRGITENAAGQFHLRFAPEARRTNRDAVYVGPSIILPHYWAGRLVGWQQRWLDPQVEGKTEETPEGHRPFWVPKYTMTPDFPKNETLYGYDRALLWLKDNLADEVVLVESVPSALFLWSYDVPAVATFGSGVDEAQMKLLRRIPRVVLAPDNDEAGVKWANSLATYLESYIGVSTLPVLEGAGSDIGDLAAQPELLPEYLNMAYNSVDTVL